MLKKDAFDYGAHLVKSLCVGVHQTVEKEDVGAGRHLQFMMMMMMMMIMVIMMMMRTILMSDDHERLINLDSRLPPSHPIAGLLLKYNNSQH